jgi:predicted aconitase with swiveling domain
MRSNGIDENVVCRSYTRKAAESAILGVLNKSVDPMLISLAMINSIPLVGGFAGAFMTAVLAERFDRALHQRK